MCEVTSAQRKVWSQTLYPQCCTYKAAPVTHPGTIRSTSKQQALMLAGAAARLQPGRAEPRESWVRWSSVGEGPWHREQQSVPRADGTVALLTAQPVAPSEAAAWGSSSKDRKQLFLSVHLLLDRSHSRALVASSFTD